MAYKINVRKDTINNSNYKPSHNRIRLRQSDWESLLQQEAEKHRKQVGIDTLAADLKSMGQTVQNIYGGWQTAETMQKTRADVEAMYNRINYYQKYRDMFGGEDLSELQKSYKNVLDMWDTQTAVYGQYKNGEAYAADKKNTELSNRFRVKTGTDAETGEDIYRGLTFDEVQAEMKKYAPDSDEYKFLSIYTGYTDLKDFDKALEANHQKMADEAATSVVALEELKKKQWYRDAKEVYDNWEIPKTDTAAVIKAKQERDEYLKRVLGDELYGIFTKATNGENPVASQDAKTYKKELEKQRDVWSLDHSFDLYVDIMQNEDFEEKSGYVEDDAGIKYNGKTIESIEDENYAFINSSEGSAVWRHLKTYENERGERLEDITSSQEMKGYHKLTEDERRVYNYLHYEDKKNGTNKAQKFLDDMERTLTKRISDKSSKDLNERAKDYGFVEMALLNIASVPAKIVGGVTGFVDTVSDAVQGKKYNPYSYYKSFSNFANEVQGITSEKIEAATEGMELFGENIPSFLYNTGMSIVDSTASVLTTGTFAPAIMASNAFQQKAKELTEAGESQFTIYTGALVSGAAEYIFEKIGLDKLLKIKDVDSLGKFVKSSLGQGGIGALEEIGTEVTNILSDTILRGENSELYQMYEDLKRRGYSESEIATELAKKVGSQVGWAGVGGFLSSSVMGGGMSFKSYVQASAVGKAIKNGGRVNEMLDVANLTVEGMHTNEIYSEYVSKGVNAKNITNAQLGTLYLSAKADANEMLSSKKVTTEQKNRATNILDGLAIVEKPANATMQANGEIANAVNVDGQAQAEIGQTVDQQSDSGYNDVVSINENNGGNVNAEQGLLRNGSERTGRTSTNPESGSGTVQEHDGGSNREVQSNGNFGRISQVFPNQGNNRRLTTDQKERYDATILKYKSSESYKINSKLREDDVLTEEEQEFVNTLDEALEQLPTYEGTVYRQIIFDDFGEELFNQFLQEHSPGQIVSYPSFTSCSTTHDGYTVEGHYKVQLLVEGKSARNVDGYGNNMENEVIFPRDSTFIVKNIDANGQYPIIYLQEAFENGYNTTEEYSNAVQHMQAPNTIHGDMQSVSKENTEGNHIRQVRPQSAASGGQWNTVRAGGEQEAVLSAESAKQEVISGDESAPTGRRVLDMPAITVKQQNYIKGIAKRLGRTVEFVNMEKFLKRHDIDTEGLKIYPDGAIDGEGNIYIWYNAEKPVQFLFKHELTHFGERSKYYKQFVEVVRSSKVYLEWLKKTTKMEGASREVMEAELMEQHRSAQKGLKTLKFNEARAEIIADFVGEKCFGESLEDMNKLVKSINDVKERNTVIRFLHNFSLWLKNKLVGIGAIKKEISVIEENFARMIADADNTKTPDTQDGGLRYSIATDSQGDFVRIDTSQEIFDGKTTREMQDIARRIIRDNFRGKVLSVGKNGRAFVSKLSSDEYAYPANRRMEDGLKESKMRAAPELDNLLSVSKFIEHQNDDGRHPQATGGWDVYSTRFEVGGTMFSGEVKIMVTDRGYLFYDITKIKRLPVNGGLTENNSVAASGNPSIDSINHNGTPVNSNSMQESENYSSEKNDLKFSIPTATESDTDTENTDFTAEFKGLMQSFQNGEISQDEYMRRVSELYQSSIDENGQIKQGEMVEPPNKPYPVPKSVKDGTKVRQHVSRILESGRATSEQENILKEMILDDKFSYTPTSNEANIKRAEKAIEQEGYQNARENWKQSIANWAADADTVAKGEALLQLAIEQKNAVDIVNLAAELAELGTRIGQGLQAMSLVKRMGGLSQLVYLQRCVSSINESLKKRIEKGKTKAVKIDERLAQQLAESKTEEEFEITYAAIVKDIAAQVPPTFADKWNALRYVCMLFNPVTHIRNIVGNAIFIPGVRIKELLAVGMEKTISKDKRTKVVKVKKDYQEYAEKDFNEVVDLMTGTGKYNPSDEIRSNQRIFKSQVLETVRKFNFDLLEKEDAIFLKKHYRHALGGYLQAQGIDLKEVTSKQLTKAREYAMQEAMKATYRDASKAANMISRLAKTNAALEITMEGLLPYKKTPINIIKRGVEYSPIGLIKTLSKGIYDLKAEKISVTEFIDGLASGLTGTGICVVGALLAALGVAKGSFDDEEKWFRKLNGEQEYSIEIGGVSYTIDWATPASIPLFLGVAIAEYDADEDADILSSIWDFGVAAFEPLLNLSLLSGIEDAVEAVSYADDGEKITSFLGATTESYISQFLPSVFGKAANLFDGTRRTTYIDRTSNVPAIVQEAWDKIASKIPFVSMTRAKYIDAWGETQYTGNVVQRFSQQFVSPGYASTVNVSDISEELMRLYRQTEVSGIFPSTPKKYLTIKGNRKDLSREDYFNYATFKGQTQFDLVDEAIHSEKYAKLTDEQKAAVIKDIYSYAGALAKCQLEYSYEEVAAMEGGTDVLTEERWKKLNSKAKQMLIEDWCMEGNKTAYKQAQNGGSVVEYFCKKAKE